MALIIKHNEGGCEAIVRQIGNELTDLTVHIFCCTNPSTTAIELLGRTIYKVCDEHKMEWLEKWDDAREV